MFRRHFRVLPMRRYEKVTLGGLVAGVVVVAAILVIVHQLQLHALVKRAIEAELYCGSSACNDTTD